MNYASIGKNENARETSKGELIKRKAEKARGVGAKQLERLVEEAAGRNSPARGHSQSGNAQHRLEKETREQCRFARPGRRH